MSYDLRKAIYANHLRVVVKSITLHDEGEQGVVSMNEGYNSAIGIHSNE